MIIRMRYWVSGGRADGSEWPPAGERLEVSDAEGAELVAAGLAEEIPEERAADPPRPPRPRSSPASSARAKPGTTA